MPKRTSPAEPSVPAPRVVLVTMDSHLAHAALRADAELQRRVPGLRLGVHTTSVFGNDPQALQACLDDIARADIVVVTMLFMEDHFLPVLPALRARRDRCDAMVCLMSAGEVMRLTRMGRFRMDAPVSGPMALLKKLRGRDREGDAAAADPATQASQRSAAGARQMKMLQHLPRLLRFIPGTAQDVRAYFLSMQYWLAGSQENIVQLVLHLVDRYADGAGRHLRGTLSPALPRSYPEVGLYHPRLADGLTERVQDLPPVARTGQRGTVGLLLMRSYLLAGNTRHYDGVITALEARGLRVLPAFASGLDNRPAIERFFMHEGRPAIDALVSLTGFSLVGGPAYNDARGAEDTLARLDVPYLSVNALEFQTLEQWSDSERGLMPVESTMMVAIPELDGATGSMVYGGRSAGDAAQPAAGIHDMQVDVERADTLAARVQRLVDLRRSRRAERKVGVVIFNFPPNAGNTGTAAFLGVFESLHNTLAAMQREGYTVELPADVDALRRALLEGNAAAHGTPVNVFHHIPADEHVRRERHLAEIEAHWGPAPGRHQADGRGLFVYGQRFGNVFVGVQPAFGHEGDPMRLLFERGFAPTHAFSAFYRWLREDFGADVLLHFGTHGALEFMPGKQSGLSARCWPDRLIGDVPNVYLYAANNPSEGTLAKRRAAATLVSHLTPPVSQAGLYKGLVDLKEVVERHRRTEPEAQAERAELATMAQAQAALLDLCAAEPPWGAQADARMGALSAQVLELEYTLIPHGLHVVGRVPTPAQLIELLQASAEASHGLRLDAVRLQAVLSGGAAADAGLPEGLGDTLRTLHRQLGEDTEIDGLLRALDGRFVRPAPGGDLLRTPAVLPTGRNLHGFDPFRLPSAYAMRDGARQAERLLERHRADGHGLPASIAMVLWGTDNLKSEGGPIAQALALMGARPRFDGYGRLAGAELVPLAELGRARVDVAISLSGIFRDLLPLQVRLLAEAAWLAASADEPLELNPIRRHALAHQAAHGGDLETAALRVFGNAEGAYGAHVSSLVDSSRWDGTDELAETFTRRKGFAYGRNGRPQAQPQLLQGVLSRVELAYQNLDSVELGVTTVDTYFDTLGGVSRAVQRARGAHAPVAPVYIGDQTCASDGGGSVRSLGEQVALETRTRMLNPRWYEDMLAHGHEGVRQLEVHMTNTMGWSATTGQVQPWVYEQLSRTFVLDPEMRERLASLNPHSSARIAHRLIEAVDRHFWQPDGAMLDALQRAGEELEDRIEGVYEGARA
ncbi:magnesium chelatase subunit H [Hydrogenophaga crocea]|uniref:magnesium chelatase n=1 Tax=Hydrogenophaga crocea TaxID=2716225 RepID=A0A6G8IN12_9BURK|nr:magnesium chelatase subunit H [Hydrogenophaga crocea]